MAPTPAASHLLAGTLAGCAAGGHHPQLRHQQHPSQCLHTGPTAITPLGAPQSRCVHIASTQMCDARNDSWKGSATLRLQASQRLWGGQGRGGGGWGGGGV